MAIWKKNTGKTWGIIFCNIGRHSVNKKKKHQTYTAFIKKNAIIQNIYSEHTLQSYIKT